jgi:hypothetical protein
MLSHRFYTTKSVPLNATIERKEKITQAEKTAPKINQEKGANLVPGTGKKIE